MSETSPQGQTAANPPPPAPQRLLRRATRDRWLGGVGTGFARYLGIDPVLARVGILVLGLILWWPILVLYIACLFVIPADDAPDARNPDHFVDRHGKALTIITGVVLVLALLGNFDNGRGPWHPSWVFFVLLIAAPVLFVVWLVRKDRPNPFGPTQTGPNTPAAGRPDSAGTWAGEGAGWSATAEWSTRPPYPGASQPVYAQTAAPAPAASGITPPLMSDPPPVPPTPYPAAAYTAAPYFAQPDPNWKPRERSALGPLTVGAGLVTAGTLVALDRADVVDVPTVVVLASTLAVVGLGLVVGAVLGRARGLIALGVALSIVTAIAGVVHLPASNSVGDQTWQPLTAAEVAPTYEWGVGEARLDLSTVRSPLTPVSTRVELGIGELRVVIPRDATLRFHGEVGMGQIDVLDPSGPTTSVDGISRELTKTFTATPPAREPTIIDLDVSVGIGHVEVDRA